MPNKKLNIGNITGHLILIPNFRWYKKSKYLKKWSSKKLEIGSIYFGEFLPWCISHLEILTQYLVANILTSNITNYFTLDKYTVVIKKPISDYVYSQLLLLLS